MYLTEVKKGLVQSRILRLEQLEILDSLKVMLSLTPDKKMYHASYGHSLTLRQQTSQWYQKTKTILDKDKDNSTH